MMFHLALSARRAGAVFATLAVGATLSVAPAQAAPPGARAAAAFQSHWAYVDVSVATVWTDPSKPRPVDRPALTDPAHPRAWIAAMSPAQEEQLTDDNMTQTQALYGAKVRVIAHQGHWSEVAVPGQPTPKNTIGYPGWVPDAQLSRAPAYARAQARRPFALVQQAPTARLFREAGLRHAELEISANTRLPVIGRTPKAFLVRTPHGDAWLRRGAATVYRSDAAIPRPTGAALVATAKKFLGQKYIWAGRSGFAFDCSGFTSTVYELHGITIPRDSGPQSQDPGARPVAVADLQPGDLLFYSHTTSAKNIYHVAMYAGDGQMLEAYDHLTPVRLTPVRLGTNYWGAVRYLAN